VLEFSSILNLLLFNGEEVLSPVKKFMHIQ